MANQYTQEELDKRFEEVCARLEMGESLRKIFVSDNRPMSNTTFFKLLREDEDKNERYRYAREIQAEDMFEEMLEIADEANLDATIDSKGRVQIDGEAVQRSKLKVDTRKWVLSKLQPKKYGDKLDIDAKVSGDIVIQMPSEADGLGE